MPGAGRPARARYYRDPELGPHYTAAMDELFSTYSSALPRVASWAEGEFPACPRSRRPPTPGRSRPRRSICCAPASRQLAVAHGHLRDGPDVRAADPPPTRPSLPEARSYGTMILDEIKAVMPSFVARVERPSARRVDLVSGESGAGWRALGAAAGAARRGTRRRAVGDAALSRRRRGRPARRASIRVGECPEERIRDTVAGLDADDRARLLAELVGTRATAGTGRGGDRGASLPVRDRRRLRRLPRPAAPRMLTIQWQSLSPDLGAGVPEQVELAGAARTTAAPSRSRGASTNGFAQRPSHRCALRAVLGYRIRFILDLNARERCS